MNAKKAKAIRAEIRKHSFPQMTIPGVFTYTAISLVATKQVEGRKKGEYATVVDEDYPVWKRVRPEMAVQKPEPSGSGTSADAYKNVDYRKPTDYVQNKEIVVDHERRIRRMNVMEHVYENRPKQMKKDWIPRTIKSKKLDIGKVIALYSRQLTANTQ